MSQTAGTPVPAANANLAAKQQRLGEIETDLMKFELAKIATGGLLKEIRDDALFLVAGGTGARAYADFTSYAQDRWNIGEREAARRIEAFDNVQRLIEAGVDPLAAPRNPWQAREIAVLVNATDVATAARTWTKALTDSQDPKLNPAGIMTGEFLKGYVTKALSNAGKARRQGTSRARPSSTGTNTGNQTSVAPPPPANVPGWSAPATPAPAPAAPAAAPATPTTQPSLQVTVATTADVSLLPDLAADVKARRMQLASPLARKPLFGGITLLLEAIEANMIKVAATSAEGQALQAALTSLSHKIADKAS